MSRDTLVNPDDCHIEMDGPDHYRVATIEGEVRVRATPGRGPEGKAWKARADQVLRRERSDAGMDVVSRRGER